MCKNEEEPIDRLLLFCEKAKMLWLLIFSLFRVQWVSEKEPPELAWFFCGQEKGESLESGPPLPDVDHLERKE